MELLKRKIDDVLRQWKNTPEHLPLVVKGARQVGKTESIRQFGRENYKNVIEINFALQKQFKKVFLTMALTYPAQRLCVRGKNFNKLLIIVTKKRKSVHKLVIRIVNRIK